MDCSQCPIPWMQLFMNDTWIMYWIHGLFLQTLFSAPLSAIHLLSMYCLGTCMLDFLILFHRSLRIFLCLSLSKNSFCLFFILDILSLNSLTLILSIMLLNPSSKFFCISSIAFLQYYLVPFLLLCWGFSIISFIMRLFSLTFLGINIIIALNLCLLILTSGSSQDWSLLIVFLLEN